jgi:hypothetical protein
MGIDLRSVCDHLTKFKRIVQAKPKICDRDTETVHKMEFTDRRSLLWKWPSREKVL